MVLKNNIETDDVIMQILRLWNRLTDTQAQMIKETLCIRQFKKGEYIYRGLSDPEHIMYLVEGKVKIFKDGIGGRNQIVKVIKPMREIYQIFTDRFLLDPEECLFVDDSAANVAAAITCGWSGIVFHQDADQLRFKMRSLGIRI